LLPTPAATSLLLADLRSAVPDARIIAHLRACTVARRRLNPGVEPHRCLETGG
jgi:hypothetical protein